MITKIHIPDICERDVDLLLLEELVTSSDFRSWFLSQIGIDYGVTLKEACRSVKHANGESDLELTFEGTQGALKVLVENKVDAAFQPNQAERYANRANDYRMSGKYREVVTVVMAPEVYFGDEANNFGFDAKVTYESTEAWFTQADHLGQRKEYKLALIRRAIDRGRRHWKPDHNPNVSAFRHSYWQLAERIATQLAMPRPKEVIPAGSHFLWFHPASLPSTISLGHKVLYGHVDLQFKGMRNHLAELEHLYRGSLLSSMRIEKAGQSAVIRICVDPIDMTCTQFEACAATVRKGIEAAVMLLDWYAKRTVGSVTMQPR